MSSDLSSLESKYRTTSKTEAGMVPLFKEILEVWKGGKITSQKQDELDKLYILTADVVDWILQNKKVSVFQDLPEDYLIEVNKFFFMTYDRIAKKLNVKDLKPAKIFPIHQDLMAKGKIGMVHRTLFTTMKERKKDDAEDKN